MRKGVSPLIATVLLIAFAVALGAVVMNWGRTYLSEAGGACGNIEFEVQSMGQGKGACYDDKLHVFVQNNGDKKLAGFRVNVLSRSDDILNKFVEEEMYPSDVKKVTFGYGDNIPRTLKITPYIGDEEVCTDKQKVVEDLPECEG